jgi:hypothetical protein
MPVLKRVEVRWASVHTPNTKFEPAYEIECLLSKEQALALKKESKELDPKGKGIKIKQDEDSGQLYIRFKRKVERPDGTSNPKPVCVSKDGKTPFEKLVGNGSICNVQYSFVAYKNPKFGEGVTNDFKGLQVLEHVAYGEVDGECFGDEDSEFDSEDTVTAPTKSKSKPKAESFDDDDFE